MILPIPNFPRKNSRESGPVVVVIELKNKEDFQGICDKLNALNLTFDYLNKIRPCLG